MQPVLTDSARKVLDDAQAEARALNQEFVGTEHMLLAMLKCSNCQVYQGKAGDAAGGCPIFAGKSVTANGWCSAWVKKA